MIRAIYLILMLVLVTGCGQNPPITTESYDYRTQMGELGQLNQWQVKGRISISTPDDAFSASFKWRKLIDYQRIEITGMLGQSYATLEITPGQALLSVQDDPPVTAPNIDQLMWSQLGFTLPVDLLTEWVKAQPTESTLNSVRLNQDGFIQSMAYEQWQVRYKKYRDYPEVERLLLPSRITVTNQRETIKLAIRSWIPL